MHCDRTVSKSLCTTTGNELVMICQKVITFLVSGEKSKHRWNNIHTMAEAKAGLQALFKMVSVSVHSLLCQGSRLTFQLASPVASERVDSLAKAIFSLARYYNVHHRIKSSKC